MSSMRSSPIHQPEWSSWNIVESNCDFPLNSWHVVLNLISFSWTVLIFVGFRHLWEHGRHALSLQHAVELVAALVLRMIQRNGRCHSTAMPQVLHDKVSVWQMLPPSVPCLSSIPLQRRPLFRGHLNCDLLSNIVTLRDGHSHLLLLVNKVHSTCIIHSLRHDQCHLPVQFLLLQMVQDGLVPRHPLLTWQRRILR